MDPLAISVALLLAVVAVTLVLRKRDRVSLLVFVDEILAFWIYWIVLVWLMCQFPWIWSGYATVFYPTLFSSGLSVLTVYKLLAYRFKHQLPVSRMSEQRASVD
jgi:hypothetical protein